MKSTFLFSLALLLLDTATSAPIPLVGDVQAANPVNLHSHATIMVPVESRKRSFPESFGSVERRMLPGLGKGKGKGKKDDDTPGSGKTAEDDVEAKRAKLEAKQARLAEFEAKRAKDPDAYKKKEPLPKETVTITIEKMKDAGIEKFWKEFTTQNKAALKSGEPNKGGDNLGLVKRDDIAAAFRKCIPDTSKLLFWSSGDLKAFRAGAIEPYAKKEKRYLVADMAESDRCEAADLADIDRKSLKGQVKTWKEKKEEEEEEEKRKKDPKKQKAKKPTYIHKWVGDALEDAYLSVGRNHYWPVMSQGFADAASGEVQYIRPDRKADEPEDYPLGIWKNHELPALKANPSVKKVVEVTMPLLTTIASNPNSEITPGSKRIRHEK